MVRPAAPPIQKPTRNAAQPRTGRPGAASFLAAGRLGHSRHTGRRLALPLTAPAQPVRCRFPLLQGSPDGGGPFRVWRSSGAYGSDSSPADRPATARSEHETGRNGRRWTPGRQLKHRWGQPRPGSNPGFGTTWGNTPHLRARDGTMPSNDLRGDPARARAARREEPFTQPRVSALGESSAPPAPHPIPPGGLQSPGRPGSRPEIWRQGVGSGSIGPRAVETATKSGEPKSTSTSQVAIRWTPPGAPNSNTISWPSKAVGHSPVNG